MKIDETNPHAFGREMDTARLAKLPQVQSLDEMELSFLDLLSTNRAAAEAAAALESPVDFTGRVQVVERELLTESQAKDKPVEKPAATQPETVATASAAREQVRKELELLKIDMTAEDMRFMKEQVIPGLPILQGSVPISQVFSVKEEGGLETRGLAVSNKLTELIEQGIKTGRPVRVELDGQSSVVLKFRNGRVSAEFMSSDKATAMYLKQNLDELRSRLEAKNLPVDLLQYRDQRKNRQQQDPHSKDS